MEWGRKPTRSSPLPHPYPFSQTSCIGQCYRMAAFRPQSSIEEEKYKSAGKNLKTDLCQILSKGAKKFFVKFITNNICSKNNIKKFCKKFVNIIYKYTYICKLSINEDVSLIKVCFSKETIPLYNQTNLFVWTGQTKLCKDMARVATARGRARQVDFCSTPGTAYTYLLTWPPCRLARSEVTAIHILELEYSYRNGSFKMPICLLWMDSSLWSLCNTNSAA